MGEEKAGRKRIEERGETPQPLPRSPLGHFTLGQFLQPEPVHRLTMQV